MVPNIGRGDIKKALSDLNITQREVARAIRQNPSAISQALRRPRSRPNTFRLVVAQIQREAQKRGKKLRW